MQQTKRPAGILFIRRLYQHSPPWRGPGISGSPSAREQQSSSDIRDGESSERKQRDYGIPDFADPLRAVLVCQSASKIRKDRPNSIIQRFDQSIEPERSSKNKYQERRESAYHYLVSEICKESRKCNQEDVSRKFTLTRRHYTYYSQTDLTLSVAKFLKTQEKMKRNKK